MSTTQENLMCMDKMVLSALNEWLILKNESRTRILNNNSDNTKSIINPLITVREWWKYYSKNIFNYFVMFNNYSSVMDIPTYSDFYDHVHEKFFSAFEQDPITFKILPDTAKISDIYKIDIDELSSLVMALIYNLKDDNNSWYLTKPKEISDIISAISWRFNTTLYRCYCNNNK